MNAQQPDEPAPQQKELSPLDWLWQEIGRRYGYQVAMEPFEGYLEKEREQVAREALRQLEQSKLEHEQAIRNQQEALNKTIQEQQNLLEEAVRKQQELLAEAIRKQQSQ
ncbi:MAG TPA: hypothetical protein VFN35_28835 [Ktedonobacteraceae bacterium]|nr:hypothetical protein [Ktedonobacteraceae bacterium]